MSFTNILVPFDDSPQAEHALQEALKIAQDAESAELHVIKVTAPPEDLVYGSMNKRAGAMFVDNADFATLVQQRNDEDSHELRERIAPVVKDFTGTVTIEVVFGIYTVDTIVDAAKYYRSDLIVMGSRGLGAIRGMLGSVSFGVLRNADLPVLIVK